MMKIKKKFSIVDLAVIFAFVCVVGSIVFRTYTKNTYFGKANNVTVEYTVEIKSADKELRKLINKGDGVYSVSDNTYWGEISKCNRTASRTYEKGNDANMISVINTSAIDITLNVQAAAFKTQNGYCINNGTFVVPGMKIRFSNGKCEFDALITAISVPDSNEIG